jgi:hypothetical protein
MLHFRWGQLDGPQYQNDEQVRVILVDEMVTVEHWSPLSLKHPRDFVSISRRRVVALHIHQMIETNQDIARLQPIALASFDANHETTMRYPLWRYP